SEEQRDDERRRVSEEIGRRLRARGVHLGGHETTDDLADLLDAVERFERAVELGGGDLMVDEPIRDGAPVSPDNAAFVLPARRGNEVVADYIVRVDAAADRARRAGDDR